MNSSRNQFRVINQKISTGTNMSTTDGASSSKRFVEYATTRQKIVAGYVAKHDEMVALVKKLEGMHEITTKGTILLFPDEDYAKNLESIATHRAAVQASLKALEEAKCKLRQFEADHNQALVMTDKAHEQDALAFREEHRLTAKTQRIWDYEPDYKHDPITSCRVYVCRTLSSMQRFECKNCSWIYWQTIIDGAAFTLKEPRTLRSDDGPFGCLVIDPGLSTEQYRAIVAALHPNDVVHLVEEEDD